MPRNETPLLEVGPAGRRRIEGHGVALPILFALLARRQGWSNAITVWSLLLQALYIALFVIEHSAY